MRVGLVYMGRHGPGGPISLQLAAHLRKYADVFATVSKNADNFQTWRESGIPLIEVDTFQNTVGAFASCLNQLSIAKLASRIRAQRPDVLLYPMVHPWTPFLQRYLRHVPDVVTVHDPLPHPGLLHRLSSSWERRAARRASRCVVLSERFVAVMEKHGIEKHRIDVIPHAMFSFYGGRDADQPGTADPKTLLFFGRITEYKGLEVLLAAYRDVAKRWPELRLKVVGEGSLERYRSLLEGLPRVEIVNCWVGDDEVARYFDDDSIVVLPYTSASQSGVIALAAAFSRPVIATSVGAIPDQIQHGESGLLVAPGSSNDLIAAIERLLKDPALSREFGKNLGTRHREENSVEKTALAYLESCRRADNVNRLAS